MSINKISIAAVLFLITGSRVFASENVNIIDSPSSSTATVYRDSSEHNRMNKDFAITYMAGGFGPSYSSLGVGINFDLYLNRNSMIELEATTGRPLYISFFGTTDIKTNSAGIHFKHFVTNSFYFRLGADYRQVDYRTTSLDLFGTEPVTDNSFKGNSWAGTVLIGNQWQWQTFTLGCDWIGYSIPFASRIESERVGGSSPDPYYLKRDEDLFTKKTSTVLVRFYLGASF